MKDFFKILKETFLKGVIPGSMIIVYKGNSSNRKFLLTKAKHSSKITFPSGSIGWRENYKMAAIRELHEETGIKAKDIVGLPISHIFKYKSILFKPKSVQHIFVYRVKNVKNLKLYSKETKWFGWENENGVRKLLSHKELISTFNKILNYL